MKTTIDLPEELVREAKLRAVSMRRPLKDLMADFIRQGLGHPTSLSAAATLPSKRLSVASDGLPLIRCRADAPASKASVAELLALEQRALSEADEQHARHAV